MITAKGSRPPQRSSCPGAPNRPVRGQPRARGSGSGGIEGVEARKPSATTFASEFIGMTNQYAQEHGGTRRAGHAHCVQAAPGHYMCAYQLASEGNADLPPDAGPMDA